MRTKKRGALLGEFFASVASPELLRFEKGDDETSWSLPVTDLSPEKLMRFSLSAMGRKIASDSSVEVMLACGGIRVGGVATLPAAVIWKVGWASNEKVKVP